MSQIRAAAPSDPRTSDLGVSITPRTWYYGQALALAKAILAGTALSLAAGPTQASAFLIRTPEAVESAIRSLLTTSLHGKHTVTKQGLQLDATTKKTLNPDLVFDDGAATGDVKYQVQGSDWDSAHLYQAVTFATGFRADRALVITFSRGQPARPALRVGDVHLTNLCWNAAPNVTYREAANQLLREVSAWLGAPNVRRDGSASSARL